MTKQERIKKQANALELNFVDAQGLAWVVCQLSNICSGKAEYIRTHFNRKDLAEFWDELASMLATVHGSATSQGATFQSLADYL